MASTDVQVYVFDCPDAELQAAGEVLAGTNSEDAQNGMYYALVDDTHDADGKPIRRGQKALTVATCATRDFAEEHAAGLPGADDERYSIDHVQDFSRWHRGGASGTMSVRSVLRSVTSTCRLGIGVQPGWGQPELATTMACCDAR